MEKREMFTITAIDNGQVNYIRKTDTLDNVCVYADAIFDALKLRGCKHVDVRVYADASTGDMNFIYNRY